LPYLTKEGKLSLERFITIRQPEEEEEKDEKQHQNWQML